MEGGEFGGLGVYRVWRDISGGSFWLWRGYIYLCINLYVVRCVLVFFFVGVWKRLFYNILF